MNSRVAVAARKEKKYEPYRAALERAGLDARMFSPDSGASLEGMAGLVLTGGTDVDPQLYHASPFPETDVPDRQRDDYESVLVRTALSRDIPLLAICRGMQLFNVVQGGTLIQHLQNTESHKQPTAGGPVHKVRMKGRIAEILGTSEAAVNSRHHQAVDRTGEELFVNARSEDGIIEGLEYRRVRFALAVQWHPEDMTDDERQIRLFRAFANAVITKT